MGRLDGKNAVVVGGGSGFGLATAERFAAEGATVAVLGRRLDVANEVAQRLGGIAYQCDVTNFDQVNSVIDDLMATWDHLDVGANFAGFEGGSPIRDLTPETWQPMVDVQLTGAVWFMRAVANAMSSHGGGSVINISSLTAQNPSAGQAAYAGSKAAVEYITKIAAVEYGPDNVRVNCVAPALIETPMTERIFKMPLVIEAVRQQTPLGHMGHVDDVANAALYFASDESGFVSGQTLVVDGASSTQKLPTRTDMANLAAARPDLT